MMSRLCVLLFFLIVIRSSHGQLDGDPPPLPDTGVRLYLGEEARVLPDFSIISAAQFHDNDQDSPGSDSSDDLNDGLWCQSANNGDMIGAWSLPDGTQVSDVDSNNFPLHVFHVTGQIGLLRDAGIASYQGLYSCVIPDENGTNQTLWVAAYGTSDFDSDDMSLFTSITRPTDFSLVSTSRDADPPVFSLTFDVNRRPPTNVTCTVEVDNGGDPVVIDISYDDLSREVVTAEDPISVNVIVTFGMRQGGTYQCNVSNDATNGSTATSLAISVTVTDTPTNLTAMRIGLYQGIVSWSPPVSNDPVVLGYELFYDLPNGTRDSIEDNNTLITFSDLDPETGYPGFVVAYGGDLPSSRSNNGTLQEAVSIDVTPSSTLLIGTDITVSCEVNITIEVTVIQVVWADPEFYPLNATDGSLTGSGMNQLIMDDLMLSLDLTLNDVNVSNAGIYTCGTIINDTLDDSAIIERQYTLTVEIPPPNVISLVTPGTQFGRTFLSGISSLFCAVNVTSIDLPPNIIFTWWGPQGQVTDDRKYDIQEGVAGDELQFGIDEEDYTHYSNLVIRDLTVMDNGTQYYCVVQVGVNNTFNQSSYIIPGTTTSDNVTVLVEALPVPVVTITLDGAPIIGESFSIICDATIEESLSPNINLTWIYNESMSNGITITNNSDGSLTLNVDPVQESHEGLYTCVAMVTIPDVPQQIVRNATYDFSTLDDPDVSIIVNDINIAGNMYTLTCEVSVVTGVPNITWIYNDTEVIEEPGITLTLQENGLNSRLILEFSPLDYDHAGVYTCTANLTVEEFEFEGFNEASQTVNVQIPTPTVIITDDGVSNMFVRGTVRSLTCNITLASYSPSSPNVTVQWMKDGVVLDVSSERVDQSELQVNGNSYTSTITFSPLNSTDAGDYTCTGTISPIGSGFDADIEPYIIGSSNTESYILMVQDIPDPVITITPIGSGNISDNYTLMCSVNIVDDLLNIQLNITFVRVIDGKYEVLEYEESSADASISVYFTPLRTSDSGRYRCSVDISQTDINYQNVFYESFTINITIPTPVVVVITDPPDAGTLVEGTYIDLVCTVTINEAVDTDVNVSIEWFRNGGSPLMNSSDYSISPISLISDQYISIIRIEELMTSDNGTTYSCSVSVQPSLSNYITGTSGSNGITLSLQKFADANVMVNIDFPSIPTAGDEFNFTCRATVPERLVHVPTGFTISYDFSGNIIVADNNPDATQSSIMRNGNVFSRDITLNPVKTSDATQYFCEVEFGDLGADNDNNGMLSVRISSPIMSLVLSPNDTIYESTSLNITCIATLPSVVNTPVSAMVSWINPSNEIITSTNDNRVTVLPAEMISNNIFESTLIFYPVDNGDEGPSNDQGEYTCEMTISSTDNLILNGVNSITEEITVEELPPLELNISTSGYTEVGQSFNITCSVRVVEGLVQQPNVTWMKMDDVSMGDMDELSIPTITVIDGPVTNVTIVLDPVLFEHRGVYICMAEFNISLTIDADSDSQEYTLIVDFPPFMVDISRNYLGTLYAGTPLTLTCEITLDDLVDIPVIVTNQWTRNMMNITEPTITETLVETDTNRYTATLEFYPLSATYDNGEYQCTILVTANTDDIYTTDITNETSTDVVVEDLPNPEVVTEVIGLEIPGEPYNLTCIVTVVDRLIVSPAIEWSKVSVFGEENDISVYPMRYKDQLSLEFEILNTSDAGEYTCDATVTVTEISVTVTNSSVEVLELQIPVPFVNVTRTQVYDDLLAGSTLTIYCDIDIDVNVDTPFNVTTTWTRNNTVLVSNSRVMIIGPYSTDFNQYQSRIEFSTLSSTMDSGVYTCDVSVTSDSDYLYVFDADNENDTTTFTVIDPVINNFNVEPNDFLGLETSCLASLDYDKFNLSCMASKPEIVLPNLEVFWLHNGVKRIDNSEITNNGTFVMNTLIFMTSTVDDTGNYTCVARIQIPYSTTIQLSGESTVTIRAARPPVIIIIIEIVVTETTATITFTVPEIAYTPEMYYIQYIGLELQNELRNSTPINGTNDINVTNATYSITLTGLEEANTYEFIVVSTNCIGNATTEVMNFTTLPALPAGPPINCTNTTFDPRTVTLEWTEPERALQNGEISGYDLRCLMDGSDIPVPDVNSTQDNPDTIYTIPVLTPFRSYDCWLAPINEIGTGPNTTMCVFMTAQDRPEDPPQDFTATDTTVSVTFSWNPPTIPNGIITEYNLTVITNGTSTSDILNAETENFIVSRFVPYQEYSATIAAATVAGYGPIDNITGRTEPDISSPVILFTIPNRVRGGNFNDTLPSVNSTTLNVTWLPPVTPNGFIEYYNIDVTNRKGDQTRFPFFNFQVTSVEGQTQYTQLVCNLKPGVPYNITIGAVNEVGQGMNVSVLAFSSIQTENLANVINVEATRSEDGTSMTVTWTPLSLEEVGGFFEIEVVASVSNDRRRQQTDIRERVPYSESSAELTGLDPNDDYSVTARTVLTGSDGSTASGPTSEPLEVDSPVTTDPPSSTDSTALIVGIVVAVILSILIAIVIIIVIILIIRYRRHSHGRLYFTSNGRGKKQKDLFELTSSTSPGTVLRPLDEPPDDTDLSFNGGESKGTSFALLQTTKDDEEEEEVREKDEGHLDEHMIMERMKPIAKQSFHEHVQQLHQEADKGFESEYKSVPMQTETSYEVGKDDNNKSKNRFANIYPYDFSRVKLSEVQGVPGSHYINASFVDGYNRKDCYVCAQGPLPTSITDFWRMVWEYRLSNIVMLTGVIEGGKKKCEQYWPEKVGEVMEIEGGLQVIMTSHVPFSDYAIHSMKLTKPSDTDSQPLEVTHFHFTAWPDHGVPQFATSLISFIKRVQKSHDKDRGVPLVVHCSAGVGRTGTFVMLDSMMDRLKVEDSINVYEFLRQMRSKRMYMVQTLAQYVFLHDALDETITCGETDIPGSNLRVRVNKMNKIVPGKSTPGFQEQYQLLEQVCYLPNESVYSDAKRPYNAQKNRYPDIVPLNLNRPRLRPDGSDGSDYINASFVDGYKQRNAYIVTQGPLKNTVEDFWRMIIEFKSRCIVMLCNTVEEGQEKCYMYWPTKEGEPMEYGRMKVTLQSELPSGDYIIRKLLVVNQKGSKSEQEGVVITQFHYTMWSEHGHPTNTGPIIEMIDMLTRAQMNTGNKPITVMCNDGVGRSGAFLCIHSQLERLKTEGEVDVFKYLKSARTKRIGLLSEMDHYVFTHEVLADYVESFDPYANFKV